MLYQYGVGFDAGSSHTSMYVFKWPSQKLNGTGIVEQVMKCPSKSQRKSSYTHTLFQHLQISYFSMTMTSLYRIYSVTAVLVSKYGLLQLSVARID